MIKYEKYSPTSSTYGLLGKTVLELDTIFDDHEPNECSAWTPKWLPRP